MNKYIVSALVLGASAVTFTACDDYLDTMPDNRTTLDSEFKIEKMLTSAYPDHDYATVLELISDNADDFGTRVPSNGRWFDDTFKWKDEMESNNSSAKNIWESCYNGIAVTNEVLDAIGTPGTTKMRQLRAEALMCRAYHHFILASVFCDRWTQNAEEPLGLPYMTMSEKELSPKYERGNLKDFYQHIQDDMEEALKDISDDYYSVPKYHFNVRAAYAFATRFYCFTEQWEKAIDAANKCLGSSPESVLRDWKAMAAMTQSFEAVTDAYIDASAPCNLLITTGYSTLGVMFGPYTSYGRYNHGNAIAANEDIATTNVFGSWTYFRIRPKHYVGGTYDKYIFWKMPYKFEYTDLVAGIGYNHTVIPVLTTDETLLYRAEAYVMTKQFDLAAADLTMWMKAITTRNMTLTPQNIVSFYNSKNYSYDDANKSVGTVKKHLNPAFAIDAEGSTQECMLQCVLGFRRIETLHQGHRWWDIKRYGIEIPRRLINASNGVESVYDWLSKDDKRRILQIPQDVRDAGFQPNPR